MSDIQKILDLRTQFRKELENPHLDSVGKLVIRSKIVAIGQVLDAIGYVEDTNDGADLDELLNKIKD